MKESKCSILKKEDYFAQKKKKEDYFRDLLKQGN